MASPFLLEVHTEHGGSVNCMAVSEDGCLLITGSDDGAVRVWSAAGGGFESSCLAEMRGHEKRVTCVAVYESQAFSGSADATVRKWDISTGDCLFVYEGHGAMVNRLLVTNALVISSSYDKTARVWAMHVAEGSCTTDNACLRILEGHQKGVYPIAFIPKRNYELAFSSDEIDEDLIVTGSIDGTARSWSLESGKEVRQFAGHRGPVQALAVDADGLLLFTASADASVISWQLADGQPLRRFRAHQQPVTALLVSGKYLYTASADRTAKSWVIEFGDEAVAFKGHKQSVTCLALADGILYTGSGEGVIRGFDMRTGQLKRLFKGHVYTINCIKVLNSKLFSGSFDNTLRVWTLEGIKEAKEPNKLQKKTDQAVLV